MLPKQYNVLVFVSDSTVVQTIKKYIDTETEYKQYVLNRKQLIAMPNLVNTITEGPAPYIILSTPVAQTSMTFPQLHVVIDDI